MLKSVEKSGFHLTIRQMLESDYKISYRDKLTTGNISDQGVLNRTAHLYDGTTPVCNNSSTSPVTSPLKLSSLLNSGEVPYTQDVPVNTSNHSLQQQQSSQQAKRQQSVPSQMNNTENNIYNLGTLEEFVNSGDLTDLYHTLWNGNISDPFL